MATLEVNTLGSIDNARGHYLARARQRVEQARSALVVTSPAQQAAYDAKLAEARALLHDGDFNRESPWLYGECIARGDDVTLEVATGLARRIVAAHTDTEQRNRAIESARIAAQEAIRRAGDVATMQQALSQLEDRLR